MDKKQTIVEENATAAHIPEFQLIIILCAEAQTGDELLQCQISGPSQGDLLWQFPRFELPWSEECGIEETVLDLIENNRGFLSMATGLTIPEATIKNLHILERISTCIYFTKMPDHFPSNETQLWLQQIGVKFRRVTLIDLMNSYKSQNTEPKDLRALKAWIEDRNFEME